jgi:hypothetical protein
LRYESVDRSVPIDDTLTCDGSSFPAISHGAKSGHFTISRSRGGVAVLWQASGVVELYYLEHGHLLIRIRQIGNQRACFRLKSIVAIIFSLTGFLMQEVSCVGVQLSSSDCANCCQLGPIRRTVFFRGIAWRIRVAPADGRLHTSAWNM